MSDLGKKLNKNRDLKEKQPSPVYKSSYLLVIVIAALLYLVTTSLFNNISHEAKLNKQTLFTTSHDTLTETYKDNKYGFSFKYSRSFELSDYSPCINSSESKNNCLVQIIINPLDRKYSPRAVFWLYSSAENLQISGQVSSIYFDKLSKAWVLDTSGQTEKIKDWGKTDAGLDIYVSENGGSHGTANYYIIEDTQSESVAVFSIPHSYRLRCDNFVDNNYEEEECNKYYRSIIKRYNNGNEIPDTWLPENYISTLYSSSESVIKSFNF